MAQHFLLSANARTLSLKGIMRMTDDEAHGRFQAMRCADNGGQPFCPRYECTKIYAFTTRRIWKCRDCLHQFSVTSGTIFASRKLPIRDDIRLHVPAKRQSVIVARQRDGRTLTAICAKESDGAEFVRAVVEPSATVHADEAGGWDRLHALYEMRRINHSVAFSKDGACTNQAESFFARLRRAEIGQHHHISGKYLGAYAAEMAWKEDNRRQSNGALHVAATGAARGHPVSRVWAGYWQR